MREDIGHPGPVKAGCVRLLFRLAFIFVMLPIAHGYMLVNAEGATCNETCTVDTDCDSTCPVCIGTCVSCYELGNATTCLDAGTGGSTNCQWDGQNCKSITDVPAMPSRRFWLFLLLPLVLTVIYFLRFRKLRAVLTKKD